MKSIKARQPLDRPVTQSLLDEAIERGKTRQAVGLQAVGVSYQDPCLVIRFEDGCGVLLPPAQYAELDGFDKADLEALTVGFGGTALCHADKDLQVSIAGMISASKPLMAMAASVIASRNGRQSSAAKAEAARANGRKGGRPRKVEIAQ
ncbi:hypothetical protein GIW70_10710 [Pseudomonas syringae]|nr:hypothetical protein [Pseudomonas syringae]MCF5068668.1 hypothetical protein [Pseudomonas syringae]